MVLAELEDLLSGTLIVSLASNQPANKVVLQVAAKRKTALANKRNIECLI